MAVTAARWGEYIGGEAIGSPTADVPQSAATLLSNTNWGSTNAVNLNTTSFPISQATNSFFKQNAVKFELTGGTVVSNFRLWGSAQVGANGVLGTPATSDTLRFIDTTNQTVVTPTTTLIGAGFMPNTEPGSNVTPASISITGNSTNLFRHQVVVAAGSTAGVAGVQLSFKYDVAT